MPPAESLQDAANSENTLQGYAAMNKTGEEEEIARIAYGYYLERGGKEGSTEEDWIRAENEVRQRRNRRA